MCVCVPQRLLITSAMIWTLNNWLNQFYSFYMAIVVIMVNGCGLDIDMHHSELASAVYGVNIL